MVDLLLRGIDGNKVLGRFVKPSVLVEERMFLSGCDSVLQWIMFRIAHARVLLQTIAVSIRFALPERCLLVCSRRARNVVHGPSKRNHRNVSMHQGLKQSLNCGSCLRVQVLPLVSRTLCSENYASRAFTSQEDQ